MSAILALQLKAVALGWLRYGKRMSLVMTEVGRWNADVMGFSSRISVEVEVKTSKADLKREFVSKTAKHWLYQNASDTSQVPNLFYFLVHDELAEAALEIINEHAPKAGLAVYDTTSGPFDRDAVRVAKKPTKLKDSPPSKQMIQTAMARCSSELCGLYQWNVQYLRKFEVDHLEGLKNINRLAARAAGTLDHEQPVPDLDIRAMELANAVEGVTPDQFMLLSLEKKRKWLEAAQRLLDADFVNYHGGWIHEPHLLQ